MIPGTVLMTVIPTDWLKWRESIPEVEQRLADEGAPDIWLEEWRRFVGHFGPDDELWHDDALMQDDPSDDWDLSDMMVGYARVRDGEAVETMSTAWH